MERATSAVGLFVLIFAAWLMSSRRRGFNFRLVAIGLVLQFVLAAFVLWSPPGKAMFDGINICFGKLTEFVESGSSFVFNMHLGDKKPNDNLLHSFAFGVLPTIICFSSFMGVLYYFGVMQWIVQGMSVVMQKALGISGAESLAATANIFVGHTEAPLVIRPYLAHLTRSELMVVMIGGFSTISGGLLAAFHQMGIDAGHLVTASIISAPAAIVIAKILEPETKVPATLGGAKVEIPRRGVNVIEAAAIGASEGMKLAINVAAMLIAFLAIIAVLDAIIGGIGSLVGLEISMKLILSYLFAPVAFLLGIPLEDCLKSGELLGLKMMANEFVAYADLSVWMTSGTPPNPRTELILTYALSGFSNVGAIGIQIAGIGGLVPERQSEIAQLGFRAMLGGAIACCMTACVAGILS